MQQFLGGQAKKIVHRSQSPPSLDPKIAALRQAEIVVCGEIEQDQIVAAADCVNALCEPAAVTVLDGKRFGHSQTSLCYS